jgi:D-alanine-D-alanine ligase
VSVELSGVDLDLSLRSSAEPTETIALVYNVKSEASPVGSSGSMIQQQPSPILSGENPSGISSADLSPVVVAAPSERVNDLFAEWDTMDTVTAVRVALEERYDVTMIEADDTAYEKFRSIKPFFAFNIAEGLRGPSREAQIPAMLEMLGIPYLGSDPLTLGICLDKSRAKEILGHYGIPTPAFTVIESLDTIYELPFRLPAIVKPLHEGSSKGIYNSSVVRTRLELEREVRTVLAVYREPALVEEFLEGREFTVAILGNDDRARVLPVVEIKFDALPPGANPIYSYEAKWLWDTVEKPLDIYECPARLSGPLTRAVEELCLRAYRILRCRDWARIDVRLDRQGQPQILEINPLPGILPRPEDNSCFPKAARTAGMTYNQLINGVLDLAMERCGVAAQGHSIAGPVYRAQSM